MTEDSSFKQVMVVRMDLGMGRGKIAVQCSHAAVSSADTARTKFPKWHNAWLREGQTKIAVKVKDIDELMDLERRARSIPIPSYLVQDKGLTQVLPGSITCLGLGPAPSGIVDSLTGKLPLL